MEGIKIAWDMDTEARGYRLGTTSIIDQYKALTIYMAGQNERNVGTGKAVVREIVVGGLH